MSKRFFEIIEDGHITWFAVAESPGEALALFRNTDVAADIEEDGESYELSITEISENSAQVIRLTPENPGDPVYLGNAPIGFLACAEN
jgi:hypothetical protein